MMHSLFTNDWEKGYLDNGATNLEWHTKPEQ